jgi:hypothetical protein
LIQQHLAAGLFDHVAEMLVLLLAVLKLVQMRPPHQPLDDGASFGSAAEQLGDRRPIFAHLLVRVTPPVREEQVVAGTQRLDLCDEVAEVRRAVDQRLGPIALAPGRHPRHGIASFRCGEEPVGKIRHLLGMPT